jgi:hypothetical protein
MVKANAAAANKAATGRKDGEDVFNARFLLKEWSCTAG